MALFIWLALLSQALCISGIKETYYKYYEPGEYISTEVNDSEFTRYEDHDSASQTRMFVGIPNDSRRNLGNPKDAIQPKSVIPENTNRHIPRKSDHLLGNYAFTTPSASTNPASTRQQISNYPRPSRSARHNKTPLTNPQMSKNSFHPGVLHSLMPMYPMGKTSNHTSAIGSLPEFISTSPKSPDRYSGPSNLPTTAMKFTASRNKYPLNKLSTYNLQFPISHVMESSKSHSYKPNQGRSDSGGSIHRVQVPQRYEATFSNAGVSPLNSELNKYKNRIPSLPNLENLVGSTGSAAPNYPMQTHFDSDRVINLIETPRIQEYYQSIAEEKDEASEEDSPLPALVFTSNSRDSDKLNPYYTIQTIPNKGNSLSNAADYSSDSEFTVSQLPTSEFNVASKTQNLLDLNYQDHSKERGTAPSYSELNQYKSTFPSSSNFKKTASYKRPDALNQPTQTGSKSNYLSGAKFPLLGQSELEYQKLDYASGSKLLIPKHSRNNKATIEGDSNYINEILSASLSQPLTDEYDDDTIQGANVYFSRSHKPFKMSLPVSKQPPTDYSARGQSPAPGEEEMHPSQSEVAAESSNENSEDKLPHSVKSADNSFDNSTDKTSVTVDNSIPFNWLNAGYTQYPNSFHINPFNYGLLIMGLLKNPLFPGHSLYSIPKFVGPIPNPPNHYIPSLAVPSFLPSFGLRPFGNPAMSNALSGLSQLLNASLESNSTNSSITQKTSEEISGLSILDDKNQLKQPVLTYGKHTGLLSGTNSIYNGIPFAYPILSGISNNGVSMPSIPSIAGFKGFLDIPYPQHQNIPFNRAEVFPKYQHAVQGSILQNSLFQGYPPHLKYLMTQPWAIPFLGFGRNEPLPNFQASGLTLYPGLPFGNRLL